MLSRLAVVCSLVLALLSGSSAFAGASSTSKSVDLGTLTSTYSYSDVIYHKSSKKFADVFSFEVPENYTADVSIMVTALNFFKPLFGMKKLGLEDLDGAKAGTSLTYSNLASGEYSFSVLGNAFGKLGGFYRMSFVASLSPVPEPATLAMLLAGLGLILVTARRRSSIR